MEHLRTQFVLWCTRASRHGQPTLSGAKRGQEYNRCWLHKRMVAQQVAQTAGAFFLFSCFRVSRCEHKHPGKKGRGETSSGAACVINQTARADRMAVKGMRGDKRVLPSHPCQVSALPHLGDAVLARPFATSVCDATILGRPVRSPYCCCPAPDCVSPA